MIISYFCVKLILVSKKIGDKFGSYEKIAVYLHRLKGIILLSSIFIAGVAQLVERQPSKLNVASSNLVSRSKNKAC